MSLLESVVRLRFGIDQNAILNDGTAPPECKSPTPGDLANAVKRLRVRAAANGDQLDYRSLSKSQEYGEYRALAAALREIDPAELGHTHEQMAFWINLYNGLIIDGVVRWRICRSVQEFPGFFWRAAYNVGGHRFSASDIEHGILRANAAYPAWPMPMFGQSDPRRRFALAQRDPRVHFALVCASRSCPSISAYRPSGLDDQLTLAAQAFVRGGGVELVPDDRLVRLSRIFQWYAPDFGARWMAIGDKSRLLEFILPYLTPENAALLEAHSWKVSFMHYDWSLNGEWSHNPS